MIKDLIQWPNAKDGVQMHTKVMKTGNSRGILIPSPFLKACNIEDTVDINLLEGKLIITAIALPRSGWDESFKAMYTASDDKLFLGLQPDENSVDWTW